MGKKYLNTKSGTLEDSILSVWQNAAEELDPVNKKAVKKKFKNRKDKDIDNDGDVDDSDKFLHKKRKAITKAIKADESVSEDHDCDEVHPDVSHKEWEKTQKEAAAQDMAAYKKRKQQEEGAEVDIAREKEKQEKSKEKIKDLSDRLAAEKEAERE